MLLLLPTAMLHATEDEHAIQELFILILVLHSSCWQMLWSVQPKLGKAGSSYQFFCWGFQPLFLVMSHQAAAEAATSVQVSWQSPELAALQPRTKPVPQSALRL